MGFNIYFLTSAIVVGSIFVYLQITFKWECKFWSRIPFKVSKIGRALIWGIFAILFQYIVEIGLEAITDIEPILELCTGMSMGLCLGLIPIESPQK